MTEHILSMLGLALKAGRVEVGEEPVGAAARAKKARVIFVAQDAAPSSVRRAQSFARTGSTLCVTLPAGKDTLGRSLGRTSVAMCAVTDIGFAQSLVQKLAVLDAAYQDAADTLAVKARRARERKEEQLRHEKNLRQGKKRVHAEKPAEPEPAPPPARPAAKRPSRPNSDRRRAERPKRRTEPPDRRFAGSLPVKKGKGSRKPSGKGKQQ